MNVLIAGGDPTGAQLASLLLEENHKVLLIEHRKDVLGLLHQQLPTDAIYEERVMDLKVLEEVGIRKADVLVACTSDDADNLVLCYLAHNLFRVPRTIGRINNPRHAWLFNQKMHVDVALNESSILAHLIGEEMTLGDMMILAKLHRGQYSLIEMVVSPVAAVVGTAIKDLQLPEQCVIAGIIRNGKVIVPRGGIRFDVGDEVLAITDPVGEEELVKLFTPNHS
ncbi:MAG: potassium transporter TrkA [Chloroflexi bacterium RBG_16_54_11]|nr:MAG: potassium transporter TrkA [Chloroflexi bacterium RBG_16_54_11]